MKMQLGKNLLGLTIVLSLAGFVPALTQGQDLPVSGYPAAQDVPGAKGLPDPNATYKVVFDISKAAEAPNQVNPGLTLLARYVNTLAKYGVPASHRKIAVVIHQAAVPMVENNEAFKKSHNGADNPNIDLIRSLAKAGVEFHVCGQGVLANKIEPKDIQPGIELDLWALTTLVDFEMQGYVHVG